MRLFRKKAMGGRRKTVAFLLSAVLLPAAMGALLAAAIAQPAAAQQVGLHELAQRVDRHYNQLHTLKAGFSESYDGMGMSRTESGTMLLAKPGKMRWDYTQPTGKLFLLDGKYAWFYTRGSGQAQRAPAKQLDDLRSPLRFLLGHTQLEKELVNLALKANGNGTYTLSGQPKGQQQRVPRLAMTVTVEGTILAIEAEENDGAITRFRFIGEQVDAPVSPSAFRLALPPGVRVVDALPPM